MSSYYETRRRRAAIQEDQAMRDKVAALPTHEARLSAIDARLVEIAQALPGAFKTGSGSSAAPLRTEQAALTKERAQVQLKIKAAVAAKAYLDLVD